jgi:N-acyl-D-aspartate/D-glutamate deacylase
MNRVLCTTVVAALLAVAGLASGASSVYSAESAGKAPAYDLVIRNGRVMDPETGRDTVANVAVNRGVITRITDQPLVGRSVIDATGLVVAPGFIDLHAHGQVRVAQELMARDGVTTALEMEIGVFPIEPFYARREGRSPINFGATVGQQGIRMQVTLGRSQPDRAEVGSSTELLRRKDVWAESPLQESQIAEALGLFEREIAAGGLGLGFAPEYVPGTDRVEALRFMAHAARLGVPVFTHVRASHHAGRGGQLEMIQEAIANAASTGVSMHICHVTSKGLRDTAVILEAIEGARRNGIDVTTEAYPYTAGSTTIGSALFNEGWQQRWGADYQSIEWPATGERLTADSFARLRRERPAEAVNFHVIPEDAMDYAIAHPLVMIASDGGAFVGGYGHPRGAGTHARVLGVYVRERKVITLMDALRKMTLMPAQRIEAVAPVMRRKGRLQEGMDADITVFDPARVIDRATYVKPMLPSEGILHVLVGGTPVVRNGALVPDATPGQGIRGRGPAPSNGGASGCGRCRP